MNCTDVKNRLNDYLDNLLEQNLATECKAHLDGCPACAQELKVMQQILTKVATLPTERAPDSLWQSIETELDREQSPAWVKLGTRLGAWFNTLKATIRIPVPILKLAGVFALLFCGILIGKFLLPFTNEQKKIVATQPVASKVQLASRAINYFEKSEILFLGIVNADLQDLRNSDWQSEQKMARNLVREASFLKENLSQKNETRMKKLVEELELILLEIALMEEQQDLQNVEMLKGSIDRKGLLLKINLQDFAGKHGSL